jgi:type IV fimbrial biogenesis protein FimT
MRTHRKPGAGFTLIELMVVLAIAGVMLTLALPRFQQLIRRQQLVTSTNALFYAVQLTRAEAVRRNRTVQLAPLDDSDWAQGWRIYASAAATGRYREGDHLILEHGVLPDGVRVDNHSGDTSEIYIAYNGGGRSTRRRGGGQLAGSWRVHAQQESRVIVINFQGRARICNPATDSKHCKP